MQIYLAITGKAEPVLVVDNELPYALASYHYYKKDKESIAAMKEAGVSVFIDSGAFSAKHSGAEIDIDEYSDYLLEVQPQVAVSLDVIGDAAATQKNYRYMKDKGVNCMPTYHLGCDFGYIDDYASECEYIAVGGMVTDGDIKASLDTMWNYILDKFPNLKVHGFGLTNQTLTVRYPWYSVDSSSWKSGKRFGRVPIFNGERLIQKDIRVFLRGLIAEGRIDDTIWDNKKQQAHLADVEGALAYYNFGKNIDPNRPMLFRQQLRLF